MFIFWPELKIFSSSAYTHTYTHAHIYMCVCVCAHKSYQNSYSWKNIKNYHILKPISGIFTVNDGLIYVFKLNSWALMCICYVFLTGWRISESRRGWGLLWPSRVTERTFISDQQKLISNFSRMSHQQITTSQDLWIMINWNICFDLILLALELSLELWIMISIFVIYVTRMKNHVPYMLNKRK